VKKGLRFPKRQKGRIKLFPNLKNKFMNMLINWARTKLLEFIASWKTSLVGVALLLEASGGLLSTVLDTTTPLEVESLQGRWELVIAAIGLIMARDNTTPSEKVAAAQKKK
tara:strand:+ start:2926 stop:3258 length:333 start_codon:yes stop_codon:yes gene_type:complete